MIVVFYSSYNKTDSSKEDVVLIENFTPNELSVGLFHCRLYFNFEEFGVVVENFLRANGIEFTINEDKNKGLGPTRYEINDENLALLLLKINRIV